MALYKLGEVLNLADKEGFAVPSISVIDTLTIRWITEVAEKEKSPVIIMIYPSEEDVIPLDEFVASARKHIEKVDVPMAIHLDHCEDYEHILQAAATGCTGVMFDGSVLPFDENVARTIEVVKAAHAIGAQVEAELGHVGDAGIETDYKKDDMFTNVSEAKRFVELTNVDALAVSVGTAHGFYKSEPKIDIERLSQINKAIDTPLVLHGGSGIPHEQIKDAVKNGINKMNIATEFYALIFDELVRIGNEKLLPFSFHYDALKLIEKPYKDCVKKYIDLLRP